MRTKDVIAGVVSSRRRKGGWNLIRVPSGDFELLDRIMVAVSRKSGVSIDDIMSHKRPDCIARARQVAMHLAAKHTGLPSKIIGPYFNKERSVVSYSDLIVAEEIKTYPERAKFVQEIEQELGL